jgi:hypothetical protein
MAGHLRHGTAIAKEDAATVLKIATAISFDLIPLSDRSTDFDHHNQ